MADTISKIVGDPRMLALLGEVERAPAAKRLATAKKLATVQALKARGIPIPEGFRITTRVFEDPSKPIDVSVPPTRVGTEQISVCASIGVRGICATVGADIDVSLKDVGIIRTTWSMMNISQGLGTDGIGDVQEIVRSKLSEISSFVATEEFQELLQDLYASPPAERARFVADVVMSEQARISRGIEIPAGLAIQRSSFGDGRPTLFCVSTELPSGYPWRKVTITFDNAQA